MARKSPTSGLSDYDLSLLRENGYVGPFEPGAPDAQTCSAADWVLNRVGDRGTTHPLYGRYSVRDWHLVNPELMGLVNHPRALSQLRSAMGDDLIMWRSNVFYKPPGTGPIGWHQDFGTFSGEDIGNNKPSLVPTHLPQIDEETLRSYLPETLALASSEPAPDQSPFWDLTLWVALCDIDADMGVLRFLKGSHRRRHPVRMGPMTDSDFWQNPFAGIHTKRQLIDACIHSRLVLDVDTSSILSGVQIAECTHEALKGFVLSELQKMRGSITAVDEVDENDVVSFPMKRGEYMIFSERTLHGSTANRSSRDRLAINFRIALSSTLIYPSRLRGDFIDGFNLDISRHESVLLCGESLNPDNRIKDP